MKKYTIPSYLLYTFIVVIVALIGIAFFSIQDGNKCFGNPLVYGAQKATNPDTGRISCSCSFSNPSYSPFFFNEYNMSVQRGIMFDE